MKYFTVFFIILATRLSADTTYISGNISANTVWDTTGSPYIVTDDLSVDDSATLRIEPGVKIAIYPGKSIKIYGRLSAIGTPTDSILFTASDPSQGWSCLSFGAAPLCSLKYCIIHYAATTGISTSSDELYVGYSNISGNGSVYSTALGLGINNGGYAIITNNIIAYNTGNYCIGFAGIGNFGSAVITDNIIYGNAAFEAGAGIINYGGVITVTGNTFTMNNGAISNNGTATIMNNNIISDGGNGSGGIVNNGPATITGNNISNNYSGGVNNSHDSVLIAHNFISNNNCSMWRKANNIENTGSFVTIKHNTIVDTGDYADSTLPTIYNSGFGVVICSTNIYSKYYAIKNDSTDSVDARYNYWWTTDTLVIDSKIWDFYDDSAKGIVYYKPFLSESLIAIEERSQRKEIRSKIEFKVIRNKIYLEMGDARDVELKVYDLCGREREVIYSGALSAGNYTFSPKIRTSGIYFVKLKAGEYKETKKLVLMK